MPGRVSPSSYNPPALVLDPPPCPTQPNRRSWPDVTGIAYPWAVSNYRPRITECKDYPSTPGHGMWQRTQSGGSVGAAGPGDYINGRLRFSASCKLLMVMIPQPGRGAWADIPPGGDLFSHSVARAVSSALVRFTSVFGMGTGGSTPLKPPGSMSTSQVSPILSPLARG